MVVRRGGVVRAKENRDERGRKGGGRRRERRRGQEVVGNGDCEGAGVAPEAAVENIRPAKAAAALKSVRLLGGL